MKQAELRKAIKGIPERGIDLDYLKDRLDLFLSRNYGSTEVVEVTLYASGDDLRTVATAIAHPVRSNSICIQVNDGFIINVKAPRQ